MYLAYAEMGIIAFTKKGKYIGMFLSKIIFAFLIRPLRRIGHRVKGSIHLSRGFYR